MQEVLFFSGWGELYRQTVCRSCSSSFLLWAICHLQARENRGNRLSGRVWTRCKCKTA